VGYQGFSGQGTVSVIKVITLRKGFSGRGIQVVRKRFAGQQTADRVTRFIRLVRMWLLGR
jgi:hypothetical protein